MLEFVLEVGCEELPATFVRGAYSDLADALWQGLAERKLLLPDASIKSMGTPRRLIVAIDGLKTRQEDEKKDVRGPAIKAAYDADGNPAGPLIGFCKSNGVDVSAVRKEDPYVWITKDVAGRPASEILEEFVPEAIRGLAFDKSMRWGASRMRFARPIRWIFATLDGKPLSFEIEGVKAGSQSHGHRFYAPEAFPASSLASLLAGLRAHKVEPDPDKRREQILEKTTVAAGKGKADISEALLEENVFLTEWPDAVCGEFLEEYVSLPAPVLVTAMAKHEKMFPVLQGETLSRNFVFIRNSGEDETVRKGSEWVLNARFNDAKFFFEEDRKYKLTDFLEKTSGMVFHEKLGTVRDRASRLDALAEIISRETGAPAEEVSWAKQAGELCKADLSTGLVSELASLQGVIGGEYARREGLPDPVCWAIASHYDLSKNPVVNCEGSRTAIRVLMADQLDKLAGYLGIGLAPSGSSDPFALRRAATMLIEAAWLWPSALPNYSFFFAGALELYKDAGFSVDSGKAMNALQEVFESRYISLLEVERRDVLDAAVMAEFGASALDPQLVQFRAKALERLAQFAAFVQTATRPLNIVSAAEKKGIAVMPASDAEALDSKEGVDLLDAAMANESSVVQAVADRDLDELASRLQGLAGPINRFFDSTMVMVDDMKVRDARLGLLKLVSNQLLLAGDFSKLVV